ncbi:MAG: imelysin family protein, partial [Spongiibacteraceae bacterium]|nr:imelysin family protein [Spongiibacteraceae bacterium]
RFGNPVVDEWEGKVNAWPLDEGLIDYVDPGYSVASDQNPLHSANVIANPRLNVGARMIDASTITPDLLENELHQVGQIEANVATGYHAIEFLLWGQDLNGTGPGAGARPWTDFAQDDRCTNDNCDRRAAYLRAATELLVSDLRWMAGEWEQGGSAREVVTGVAPDTGLAVMLTGLGSLSYGELAGERMKLALLLNDPEEEQDCFSDNTHNSHYYNVVGMEAIYLGRYLRADGSVVAGPSLSALVAARAPALDAEMRERLQASRAAMTALKERAEAGERFDQMIAPGNSAGHAVVQAAIDALTTQTRTIERIVAALELQPIEIEGSDSLDNPEAVFGSDDPAAVFQ